MVEVNGLLSILAINWNSFWVYCRISVKYIEQALFTQHPCMLLSLPYRVHSFSVSLGKYYFIYIPICHIKCHLQCSTKKK